MVNKAYDYMIERLVTQQERNGERNVTVSPPSCADDQKMLESPKPEPPD
jgi:hypothetical protein